MRDYAEQSVELERRSLFNEECLYQRRPACRRFDTNDDAQLDAFMEAAETGSPNKSLKMYRQTRETNALPMDRFLSVSHSDDPLRWMAQNEMRQMGVQSGDMLTIEKRIALEGYRPFGSQDSVAASMEMNGIGGEESAVSLLLQSVAKPRDTGAARVRRGPKLRTKRVVSTAV
jgi:hypothetical protein